MSATGRGLLLVLSVSLVLFICEGVDRSVLFSRYGPVNYGRPAYQGTYQGSQSRVGCLELCIQLDKCRSFRYSGRDENGESSCYTYTYYSHYRRLLPMENTSFYEERWCINLYDVTAAIYFDDISQMFLFRGLELRRISVVLTSYYIDFGNLYRGPVSNVFPDFVSHVDGATQYYGNNTMIISGNSVACYSRDGATFTSISCPVDLISEYFNQTGLPDLGAITTIDLTFRDLHIFRNDVTYHMWYNESLARYVYNGSTPMTEISSLWWAAPYKLTGVGHFGGDLYIMFEMGKMFFYRTSKGVVAIGFWC